MHKLIAQLFSKCKYFLEIFNEWKLYKTTAFYYNNTTIYQYMDIPVKVRM